MFINYFPIFLISLMKDQLNLYDDPYAPPISFDLNKFYIELDYSKFYNISFFNLDPNCSYLTDINSPCVNKKKCNYIRSYSVHEHKTSFNFCYSTYNGLYRKYAIVFKIKNYINTNKITVINSNYVLFCFLNFENFKFDFSSNVKSNFYYCKILNEKKLLYYLNYNSNFTFSYNDNKICLDHMRKRDADDLFYEIFSEENIIKIAFGQSVIHYTDFNHILNYNLNFREHKVKIICDSKNLDDDTHFGNSNVLPKTLSKITCPTTFHQIDSFLQLEKKCFNNIFKTKEHHWYSEVIDAITNSFPVKTIEAFYKGIEKLLFWIENFTKMITDSESWKQFFEEFGKEIFKIVILIISFLFKEFIDLLIYLKVFYPLLIGIFSFVYFGLTSKSFVYTLIVSIIIVILAFIIFL